LPQQPEVGGPGHGAASDQASDPAQQDAHRLGYLRQRRR